MPPTPRIDKQGRRLCKCLTRKSTLCTQPAMTGQLVCKMHGGKSPNALEAARRRLLEAVDPVAVELVKIAKGEASVKRKDKDGNEFEVGPSFDVRVKAIREIMDRAGLPRKTQMELSGDLHVEQSDPVAAAALRSPKAREALETLADELDWDDEAEEDAPAKRSKKKAR